MPFPPTARLLLVALALVAVCALARPASANAGLTRPEARLLQKINDVRSNHGARRLRVGDVLQGSAHKWARYLRRNDAFYHARVRVGTSEIIGWVTCRETWARTLIRMWLASGSHRPYLLGGAQRIGVGVNTGRWSGYGCVRMAVVRFR